MKLLKSGICAAIVLAATGCGSDGAGVEPSRSMEQLHEELGVPVTVKVLAPSHFEDSYTYHAILSGIEETKASSIIADKVESIKYSVGDHVTKDAVVVTFPIDNPSAQYYQAKVAFEHAETTLGRIKNLYESGGVSLQEYDNTKTQYEVTRANWDAVRQTVTVKAPIGGVLTNIAVRESDNVGPGDVLFTVANTSRLKARVWASEGQIGDIRTGDAATAEWQGNTIDGHVVQADLSLDTGRQAFGVVVEFDNTDGRVMSGVNADIVIRVGGASDIIIVDRKDVLTDSDARYVFLARNGRAVRREVLLGRSVGISVEVIEGLAIGDTLITASQHLLDDQTKIHVTD